VLIPLNYFYKKKLSAKKELGLEKPKTKWLLKKTFLLFAGMLVVSFLVSLTFILTGSSDLWRVQGIITSFNPLFLVYLLVVRVSTEEIFFRAFLVKRIGVTLSAILFGVMHLFYGSITEVVGAIALGGILGLAFQRNQNLYPNILAHFFYNLTALAFLW
jgi:hypothetical protein